MMSPFAVHKQTVDTAQRNTLARKHEARRKEELAMNKIQVIGVLSSSRSMICWHFYVLPAVDVALQVRWLLCIFFL